MFLALIPIGIIILIVWGLYRVTRDEDEHSMDNQMQPGQSAARLGPKDFFMQLFMFGTLYISVGSFINLLFAYISKLFPDNLQYYYNGGFEAIRWPMSSLIIVFPVFLILSRLINNDIALNPTKKESKLYRILVYLTLSLAGAAIVGDLIALVYYLLGGGITTQFILKILVVLVVSLAVFGYYRWHLKADFMASKGTRNMLFWSAAFAIFISIVAGFFIMGSPNKQRAREYDIERVHDLEMIDNQMQVYFKTYRRLPTSLADLESNSSYNEIPTDPKTNQPYGFKPNTSDKPYSYELCATFEEKSVDIDSLRSRSVKSLEHDAGYQCFDKFIEPRLYVSPQPVPLQPVPYY